MLQSCFCKVLCHTAAWCWPDADIAIGFQLALGSVADVFQVAPKSELWNLYKRFYRATA
jgi:hypothetical protein